jgi:hypothetical protein
VEGKFSELRVDGVLRSSQVGLPNLLAQARYTARNLTISRTYLFALAILVAAFVALYPYLGAKDMCDSGKCPMVTQSTSSGVSMACLIVALIAAPALMRFGSERRLRGAYSLL